VWLFGSRARGDAREKSDYDLAFEFPESMQSNWSKFSVTVAEDARTLHHIDLVNFKRASVELQKNITTERIIIYE
jgi:predicted nucleotidyltransferase